MHSIAQIHAREHIPDDALDVRELIGAAQVFGQPVLDFAKLERLSGPRRLSGRIEGFITAHLSDRDTAVEQQEHLVAVFSSSYAPTPAMIVVMEALLLGSRVTWP